MCVVPRVGRSAVYSQRRHGFGTVRVVPSRPALDIQLIYHWLTEERAYFWGMTERSFAEVREIFEYLDAQKTHHVYLLYRDEEPVALFQAYEPEADAVGACYEVRPGDLGWHVFIGPPRGALQAGFSDHVFDAVLTFMSSLPAVERIVAEPDVRNGKAIARFQRHRFVPGAEIDLGPKRALLMLRQK